MKAGTISIEDFRRVQRLCAGMASLTVLDRATMGGLRRGLRPTDWGCAFWLAWGEE